MTRVDFYLLPAEDDGKSLAACRLAHKAFRLGHRIYILAPNTAESDKIDQLLWTFNPGSFVPHQIHTGAPADDMPVLIGHDTPPETFKDVLISLALQAPEFFTRFERVAELVAANEAEKNAARERFRFYRERGCDVQTHNL